MPPSPPPSPPQSSTTISKAHKLSYRIGRGETGVLSFEPYKSEILPLWRFKTAAIAAESAASIQRKCEEYEERGDWVGMDMCRKFLQMGMTRATRYANRPGGRKYTYPKPNSSSSKNAPPPPPPPPPTLLPKSTSHPDHAEKAKAAAIFRAAWKEVKSGEAYVRGKERFLEEQRAWDRERGRGRGRKG